VSEIIDGTIVQYVNMLRTFEFNIYRLVTIGVILAKMILNYRTFLNNRIFLAYFSILHLGNILYLIVINGVYLPEYLPLNGAPISEQGLKIGNILFILSSLLIDTFFGLFPNFFFSIYKTSITKSIGYITMRYFIINAIILGLFFVVIIVVGITVDVSHAYVADIIIVIEVFYTTGVFIVALFTLDTVNSKVKSLLWRFFFILLALCGIICL